MKTIERDEPISRSRFADCPVCKNHTLKVKRIVRVGRCQSCKETYKIVVVYVKHPGRSKHPSLSPEARPEVKQETKPVTSPESPAPVAQPSNGGLLDTATPDYSKLAEALFGQSPKEQSSESGSGSQ